MVSLLRNSIDTARMMMKARNNMKGVYMAENMVA
jgi:hypothetical protein